MAWEHFPHGADIGVRGIGATRSEAFEQAARALTAVIADPVRLLRTRWSKFDARHPTTSSFLRTGSMR